jgi:hypothetical protein
MDTPESTVSLADLSAAGVIVRCAEAVTIVRELALRVSRGELPGIPSPHVIRLSSSGALSVEGPVAAGHLGVARAAYLLESLLPGFEAPRELRVPGALRLVVARALGSLDLPAYDSLESFTEALSRFAAEDAGTAVRELVARRAALVQAALARSEQRLIADGSGDEGDDGSDLGLPGPGSTGHPARIEPWPGADLTISDIRRARRATGLTIAEIAQRSQISSRLLRELEWGYFLNWPASHLGRRQLVRYARAAGLDDQLVVRTVWPLLEESVRERGTVAANLADAGFIDADVEEPTGLVRITRPRDRAARGRSRRMALIAALAIPAMLAIITPAVWHRSAPGSSAPPISRVAAANEPAPSPAPPATPPSAPSAAHRPAVSAPPAALRPAHLTGASRFDGAATPAAGMPDDVAYSPSFDSAGSAMFYHTDSDEGSALMRADTDGRGAILRITRVVDDRSRNFHARPSPDGARIAFDSDRDGERAVYIADADGQNVRRVSGEGFAAVPTWSPDGGTLAFVRAEPDRPKVWNLWTVELSSGQTRQLTSYRFGQPWGGSWFPDGRRIAFSHEDRLVVMNIGNRTEEVFPSPVKGRLVRTPAVSPDGRRVIFQVYRDGAWLLELRDGSMRKVLSDPSAEEYTWSPDGRRVAYHSHGTGNWGVWIMAPTSH